MGFDTIVKDAHAELKEEIKRELSHIFGVASMSLVKLNQIEADNTFSKISDGELLYSVVAIAMHLDRVSAKAKNANVTKLSAEELTYLHTCYSTLGYIKSRIALIPPKLINKKLSLSAASILEMNDYIESTNPLVQTVGAAMKFGELYASICNIHATQKAVIESSINTMLRIISDAMVKFESAVLRRLTQRDVIRIIEDGARAYSLKNRDKEKNRIMRQIRKLPDCSKMTLTPADWYKMKETEDTALSLATEMKLVESKEIYLNEYKPETRTELDNNSVMIRLLIECFYDDKLFDYQEAAETTLFKMLTPATLPLFYRLVLRSNIIRCNIKEELMAKFEAWLSCTADDIDTPETTSAEQQNLVARDFKEMEKANRIFNVRNIPYGRTKSKKIEWIFNFIDNNFICKVKAQNGWYALYKFLKDKDLLNINITTDEFSTQMNEWYPDAKAHCKRAETDRYNFLAGYDVESWDKYPKEDYPTNVTARGVKANKQHYMSLTKKYDDQK